LKKEADEKARKRLIEKKAIASYRHAYVKTNEKKMGGLQHFARLTNRRVKAKADATASASADDVAREAADHDTEARLLGQERELIKSIQREQYESLMQRRDPNKYEEMQAARAAQRQASSLSPSHPLSRVVSFLSCARV